MSSPLPFISVPQEDRGEVHHEDHGHQHQDRGRGELLATPRWAFFDVREDERRERRVVAPGAYRESPRPPWRGYPVTAPTMRSGAVSPSARAIARTDPVRTPGAAYGRTWLRTTSQRVAPTPYAGLADAVGNRPERSSVDDDDERQDHHGDRESPESSSCPRRLGAGEAPQQLRRRRRAPGSRRRSAGTPARFRMFVIDERGQPRVARVLLQVDRGARPRAGRRSRSTNTIEVQRADQALPDTRRVLEHRQVPGE